MLQDLSVSGAKVLLESERPLRQDLLRWLEFEVFAEGSWQKGRWCGLRFEELIPAAALHQTRLVATQAGLAAEQNRLVRQAAEEFVRGPSARL